MYLIGRCGSGRAWSQKATSVPPQSHPRWGQRQVSDYIPLPHPPVSLGPVEVLGTLCLLPELCLQLATQHWLGTEAELMASSHLYELGPKSWAVFGPRSCFVPSQL